MFGHVSWDTTENMVTWEREFLLDKAIEWIELTSGKPKRPE
jgi:hypothetical protein